jgi:hypothetical protein
MGGGQPTLCKNVIKAYTPAMCHLQDKCCHPGKQCSGLILINDIAVTKTFDFFLVILFDLFIVTDIIKDHERTYKIGTVSPSECIFRFSVLSAYNSS